MKKVFFLIVIVSIFSLISCKKECECIITVPSYYPGQPESKSTTTINNVRKSKDCKEFSKDKTVCYEKDK